MKLKKIEIFRFRKFFKRTTVDIANYTVLVGPNNGGKSTICDALEIFFKNLDHFTDKTIVSTDFRRRLRTRFSRRGETRRARYDSILDYPVEQKKGRIWPSAFKGTFTLTENEVKHFNSIECQLYEDNEFEIEFSWCYKTNRFFPNIPKGVDEDKYIEGVKLVAQSFKLIVIPAVRDQSNLNYNLETLFEEAIESRLEKSNQLKKINKQLHKLVDPQIKKLNNTLEKSIKQLIPEIRKVEIDWTLDVLPRADLGKVIVDDGQETPLSLKGDGIKNLVQMAQLTNLAEKVDDKKEDLNRRTRIFIIEEPESHLNSSYLHPLREKLKILANNDQLLITTHSPVFVEMYNRNSIRLVKEGNATIPKAKTNVAEALGIKIQENLRSNLIAIITESKKDILLIKKSFEISEGGREILQSIDFISAEGASKIINMKSSIDTLYEHIFILLDNDHEGKEALKNLTKFGSLKSNIFITPKNDGYKSSELEDFYPMTEIQDMIKVVFKRDYELDSLKSSKKLKKAKFSTWIEHFSNKHGLPISSAGAFKAILYERLEEKKNLQITGDGLQFFQTMLSSIRQAIGR